MMKIKILVHSILMGAILSCGVTKTTSTTEECTLTSAIEKAKDCVKKKGFDLSKYNVSYLKNEQAYLIVFSLIEIADGGGAEIAISKGDCAIIDEKYSQ